MGRLLSKGGGWRYLSLGLPSINKKRGSGIPASPPISFGYATRYDVAAGPLPPDSFPDSFRGGISGIGMAGGGTAPAGAVAGALASGSASVPAACSGVGGAAKAI